jgi:hypothetical protein
MTNGLELLGHSSDNFSCRHLVPSCLSLLGYGKVTRSSTHPIDESVALQAVVGFGGVSSGRTTPSVNLMEVRFSVLAPHFAREMVIVGERPQVRFDLSP